MSLEENKFYMAKLAEILQSAEEEAQSRARQKVGLYNDDKEVVDMQHDFIQCPTSESPCFAGKNYTQRKVAKLQTNQFQTRYPLKGPSRVSCDANAEEEKVYQSEASYCKPERRIEASQDDNSWAYQSTTSSVSAALNVLKERIYAQSAYAVDFRNQENDVKQRKISNDQIFTSGNDPTEEENCVMETPVMNQNQRNIVAGIKRMVERSQLMSQSTLEDQDLIQAQSDSPKHSPVFLPPLSCAKNVRQNPQLDSEVQNQEEHLINHRQFSYLQKLAKQINCNKTNRLNQFF